MVRLVFQYRYGRYNKTADVCHTLIVLFHKLLSEQLLTLVPVDMARSISYDLLSLLYQVHLL